MGYALAGIGDGQLDDPVGLLGFDTDVSAWPREAEGVGEQVEQDLLDPAFIGMNGADRIVAEDLHPHLGAFSR